MIIACVCWSGSSPHTRGARNQRRRGLRPSRIIPAYAGSTWVAWVVSCPLTDHPRIRGEHRPAHRRRRRPGGSSPHTRGAPSTMLGIRPVRPDHPRIRGEHAYSVYKEDDLKGSSPHTRGARSPNPGEDSEGRIIPAYAGSTSHAGTYS